jgi:Bacterial SH3 domain
MRSLRVVVLGLVALSLLLGALSVRPAEAHTGTYRTIYNLNLRAGPGGSYAILDLMPRHRVVKARGHLGNWMKLTDLTTGTTGWSWLAYLEPYTPPLPAGGTGSGGGGSGALCLVNYWGQFVCSSADVGNAIRHAAAVYGVGLWWLSALAACESSYNPWAFNSISGVSGLYQFEPSTFYWQGGVNLWNYWEQALIAAKMMANGLASHFHCLRLLGYV